MCYLHSPKIDKLSYSLNEKTPIYLKVSYLIKLVWIASLCASQALFTLPPLYHKHKQMKIISCLLAMASQLLSHYPDRRSFSRNAHYTWKKSPPEVGQKER